MRAATEGSLPPVMPQGKLVEALGREVRQESRGELMVESTPSRQRRPPCKTNKEMPDEAADAAALTYLLTHSSTVVFVFSQIYAVYANSAVTGAGAVDKLSTTATYASFRFPTAVRKRKSPKSPLVCRIGNKVKA